MQAGSVEQILLEDRAPVRADEEITQHHAAGEVRYSGDHAGEILTHCQYFAAHGRHEVIVQSALQHYGAEQVGEDAEAAEEDAEPQEVDLENAGEDHVVIAYA